MSVVWVLDNDVTTGQIRRRSQHAVVAGGWLYRESLSVLSGKPSALAGAGGQQPQEMVIAESSCFIAGATTKLTYGIESQVVEGDVTRTLYSAIEAGSTFTVYLSIATQAEFPGKISGAQGSGGSVKNASMSMSVDTTT